jgi:hypothetical protein
LDIYDVHESKERGEFTLRPAVDTIGTFTGLTSPSYVFEVDGELRDWVSPIIQRVIIIFSKIRNVQLFLFIYFYFF